MGDIKEAKEMYDRYAEVTGSWAAWRQIVVERRQPRSILVQANTSIRDEKLELHTYEASPEGFVRYRMTDFQPEYKHFMSRSWAERFESVTELDSILCKLSEKDKKFW